MDVVLSLIVGLIFGVMMMCLLNAGRTNAYINIVKLLEEAIEHERFVAIQEKKSSDYLNGMSRVLKIVQKYFEEELL